MDITVTLEAKNDEGLVMYGETSTEGIECKPEEDLYHIVDHMKRSLLNAGYQEDSISEYFK